MMQISTIASTFITNVDNLLHTISLTQSHYIKCFKPNPLQLKAQYDSSYMVEQLQCGGIVHSLQVVRTGFPIRLSYQEFWMKYYSLMVILIRETMRDEIPPDLMIKILPPEGRSKKKKKKKHRHDHKHRHGGEEEETEREDRHHEDGVGDNDDDQGKSNEETEEEEEEEATDQLLVNVEQGIDLVIQRIQLGLLTNELLSSLTEEQKHTFLFPNDQNLNFCIQRGKNLIFLRTSGYYFLNQIYNFMISQKIILLQKNFKKYLQQKKYLKFLKCLKCLQKKYLFMKKLSMWRKKVSVLRKFVKKCQKVAQRFLSMRRAGMSLLVAFRRRKIIRKWRPILRLIARFVKKVVIRIRKKCTGRYLAKILISRFRQWKIYQKWMRILKSLRVFVSRCKLYAQKLIATRFEKAIRIILRLLHVRILKRRLFRRQKMAIRLQNWVRFGSFRKYLCYKKYLEKLFTLPVMKLQKMWKWKKKIYFLIQKERMRLQRHELVGQHTNTTGSAESRKSLGKESLLHILANAEATSGVGSKRGGGHSSVHINAKSLFHCNRQILWVIVSYYCDNKTCSIPAGERKYQVGIISERGMVKLLREWGIIPAVLSFQIVQQLVAERESQQQEGERRVAVAVVLIVMFVVNLMAHPAVVVVFRTVQLFPFLHLVLPLVLASTLFINSVVFSSTSLLRLFNTLVHPPLHPPQLSLLPLPL
jgi:hypothetical protein